MLVNRITEYDFDHFYTYGTLVADEMLARGFAVDVEKFAKHFPFGGYCRVKREVLFAGWHNNRYLAQCYSNLEEKYDCGGIEKVAWEKIFDFYWFERDWDKE